MKNNIYITITVVDHFLTASKLSLSSIGTCLSVLTGGLFPFSLSLSWPCVTRMHGCDLLGLMPPDPKRLVPSA